jgi:thymidylate synthase
MYITEETLDDLLRRVIEKLLKSRNRITPTRGSATELTGVLLRIANPRARLSRTERKGTLFSCLGELLWYLAKSKNLQFISYYLPNYTMYSDDGRTIYGGYGPRLFNMDGNNQVANVIALLRRKPDSRRAVIVLFDPSDIADDHKDIPCTCTLQFMIRRRRLHMFTSMRSNDAFIGLPHDLFSFTMLQEIVARSLGVELGTYKHAIGSLHLYEEHRESARQYLEEGWQETVLMPPMPQGDPWRSIRVLLKAESAIRRGKKIIITDLTLESYWDDFVRLLQIYWHSKTGKSKEIKRLRNSMSSHVYDPYIDRRKQIAIKREADTAPVQIPLF